MSPGGLCLGFGLSAQTSGQEVAPGSGGSVQGPRTGQQPAEGRGQGLRGRAVCQPRGERSKTHHSAASTRPTFMAMLCSQRCEMKAFPEEETSLNGWVYVFVWPRRSRAVPPRPCSRGSVEAERRLCHLPAGRTPGHTDRLPAAPAPGRDPGVCVSGGDCWVESPLPFTHPAILEAHLQHHTAAGVARKNSATDHVNRSAGTHSVSASSLCPNVSFPNDSLRPCKK